jgi:non-specific serine/threonine protein kinase
MPREENIIIRQFKKIVPNQIYFIAPKAYFVRGFQYYQDGRVLSYRWDNDDRLTAIVMGKQTYTVDFFCEGTVPSGELALRYTCDCPVWTASSQCKHVICALLTTVNLVSPSLFQIPRQDPIRLNALLSSLLNGEMISPKEQQGNRPHLYEIIIDMTKGAFPITLRKNSENAHSQRTVPVNLQFLLSPFRHSFSHDTFLKYLQEWGNNTPIFLKTKECETPIFWDRSRIYESQTEVDVTHNTVSIKALCLRDKTVCESVYLIGDIVVDFADGILGVVEEKSGWKFYDHLVQLFLPKFGGAHDGQMENSASFWVSDQKTERRSKRPSFTIPLKDFQSVQINIAKEFLTARIPKSSVSFSPEAIRNVSLKVSGKALPIQISQHIYRLTLDPENDKNQNGLNQNTMATTRFNLKAECRLGDSLGMTHFPTFRFFTHIAQNRNLSSALRAKKRRGIFIDFFLFLLSSSETRADAKQRISQALSSEEFDLHDHAAMAEARDILQHFFSVFLRPDLRLQFNGNQWHLIPNDKSKEAILYAIALKYFGPQIFHEMAHHNEMAVPSAILHEKLSLFHAELADSHIELFYNGKPVIPSKWDFSFDARRSAGIDWFEIKPEIKCDGIAMQEALWRGLLDGSGLIEKEGVVHILDNNARQILKSLGAIYTMAKKTRVGKKEIVHVPRLQILDWITLRNQGVFIRLSDEDEALIARLTEFTKITPTRFPDKLTATLRPYQEDGYHWLSFLYQQRFGACLADDMGLGKTLQAINFLGGIQEEIIVPAAPIGNRPHLIVLPPSLLFNWESEITRFYPNMKIHFYLGAERNTTRFNDCDVVITTYGLVRRDIEKLKEIPFNVIIFDEAQAIKNIYADTTCAVRQLKAYFKLVMTGTPLENHLGEYYSLIDLCIPGLLGEYDPFKSQMKQDTSPAQNILIRRTRPFVMRRTKEAVLKDLPPKTETDVYLELTERQKALYQQTVAQIRTTIDEAYQKKNHAQARIIALTAILKLRQLCLSPRLLTHNTNDPSPKSDFLMERLHELMEANHSALVFSQFTSFLDIVGEALTVKKIPFSRLDGKTATGKRKGLVEGFQGGKAPSVFLLSLKAGGQGLNLTKASYVFHLDPWWNPAVENQATDRAHRIGQTQKVSITRILMRHTIEEKMMVLKQKKMGLYEAVMGDPEKAGKGFAISKQDFDFLLDA